jgi:hypothetical protein
MQQHFLEIMQMPQLLHDKLMQMDLLKILLELPHLVLILLIAHKLVVDLHKIVLIEVDYVLQKMLVIE